MCVYTNTEKGQCFLASYPEQVDVDIWASKPLVKFTSSNHQVGFIVKENDNKVTMDLLSTLAIHLISIQHNPRIQPHQAR